MKKMVAFIALVLLLFFVAGCKDGGGKFKGKKIRFSSLVSYSVAPQQALYIPFSGTSRMLDLSAGRLYKAIRQRGLFYSGPLMVALNSSPDFTKKNPLQGKMFFPVTKEAGKKAYLKERVFVQPRPMKFSGGKYISLVYKGKIAYLEAGFIRIKRKIAEEGYDIYGTPLLLFEDTFRELSGQRNIRIMFKVKRKN